VIVYLAVLRFSEESGLMPLAFDITSKATHPGHDLHSDKRGHASSLMIDSTLGPSTVLFLKLNF
jgi:hypothetical protein